MRMFNSKQSFRTNYYIAKGMILYCCTCRTSFCTAACLTGSVTHGDLKMADKGEAEKLKKCYEFLP
jgi:hypothetical protein